MLSFKSSKAVEEKYRDITDGIRAQYEGCECEFAVSDGALFTRIFDDSAGYMMLYPEALPDCDFFNAQYALGEISDYCMREGIPEVISGVPRILLSLVLLGVRHAELHAMDAEGEMLLVEIKTELHSLCGDVELMREGLCFSTPSQEYAEDYIALVRDREHNKLYGYEITDDYPDLTPSEAVAELIRENGERRTLTLFVTDGGEFIGEGVLYNFDGRGGAEISFRVARNKCGRGYGKRLLSALVSIGEEIGLIRLSARVHKDNAPSLSLMKKGGFAEADTCDGTVHFSLALYE